MVRAVMPCVMALSFGEGLSPRRFSAGVLFWALLRLASICCCGGQGVSSPGGIDPRSEDGGNQTTEITESTERDQLVAGRVRRACDDAPLSFPVRLCDAPYLLRPAEMARSRESPVRRSVRRACDDAPLSFPVRLCDAPYLLRPAEMARSRESPHAGGCPVSQSPDPVCSHA